MKFTIGEYDYVEMKVECPLELIRRRKAMRRFK